MKTLTASIILFATTNLTFAQGKINFGNDSLHLVYFSSDTCKLVTGDAGLALTMPANDTVLSIGGTLYVDLWGGSSPGNMTLQATSSEWSAARGRWSSKYVTLSQMPAFQLGYFQVVVRDSRIATGSTFAEEEANAFASQNDYFGWSPVFTAVPSASSYVNLYATTSPTLSTWPAGTQTLIGNSGFGSIELASWLDYGPPITPEPSTTALAGLGAAALLAFRRRR